MISAVMVGLGLGVGLCLLWYALAIAPHVPPRRVGPARPGRFAVSKPTRQLAAAGLAIGLLLFLVTGWAAAMVIAPAAVVGLPLLLSPPRSGTPIARIEAMEEWTRNLAGVLTVGVGLEQAISASARSAPAPIRPEVRALAGRLAARSSTEAALRSFADDLGDATGDLIVLSLLLGASRRGQGMAAVLESLAESVAFEVRIRRAVEADRAKVRTAARWITGITVVVLGGLFLNSDYVAPYRTPSGQVVLVLLLAGYVAALIWMRKIAAGKPPARLIDPHGAAA